MIRAVRGWIPLLVLPSAVLFVAPITWPRWAVMWMLAIAIYAGCKWLTWRRTPVPGAPIWLNAGFLLAWPGLDPRTFLTPTDVRPPDPREWTAALVKCVIGLSLIFLITPRIPAAHPSIAGWVGMIGIVMSLHFGVFHLLSCAWRRAGIDARPLMRAPLRSTSLAEFWGRRWNAAFRDFTHRFLYRPPVMRLGAPAAILTGFLFSGLIHDLVISVPAAGGYGGPTIFFTVQGVAMLAERSSFGIRIGLGRGTRGWLYTAVMLALPLGLLFHRPFVLKIIVPFLQALGAIR
jgi:alginate O-acetyltransferase complex protein AlgI